MGMRVSLLKKLPGVKKKFNEFCLNQVSTVKREKMKEKSKIRERQRCRVHDDI